MGETALADEFTAMLYRVSLRRARLAICSWLCALVFAVVVVVLVVVAPDAIGVVPPLGYLLFTLMIVFAAPWQLAPASWWPLAEYRLLAEQPWRETPATVLDARGTLLALPGGEHVRVYGMSAAVRDVVTRTRRVWVVGPDTARRMAVRVDGVHTPWPARRVRARNRRPAGPYDIPIATMWVNELRWRARGTVIFAAAMVLLALGHLLPPVNPWSFGLSAVNVLVAAVAGWLMFRRVAPLRRAGSWIQAKATVLDWRDRGNGLADGTVALDLPDRTLTAELAKAPLDLFANVRREGTLWIGGDEVVGYPHYPVVAAARLTVTPTRVPPVPSGG